MGAHGLLVVLSTVLLAKGSPHMVLLHGVVASVASSLYDMKDAELLLPDGLTGVQTLAAVHRAQAATAYI